MRFDGLLAAVAVLLLAFAPAVEAQSRLATNASLSVEAIRLQGASEKLLSLEQLQSQARERERNYAIQMIAVQSTKAGLIGAGTACGIIFLQQQRGCTAEEALLAGAGSAVAVAPSAAEEGRRRAKQQNVAAAHENELKQRIKIAGQQLGTAKAARINAEKVAAQNIAKLKQMRAAVAAGKASKQQLHVARADATADSKQIKAAAAAMGSGAKSLASSKQAAGAQSKTDTKNLQNAQSTMTVEQQKTVAQYNALVKAINASSL